MSIPHGIVLLFLFCLGRYMSAADRSRELYLEVSPEGHQLKASDFQIKPSMLRQNISRDQWLKLNAAAAHQEAAEAAAHQEAVSHQKITKSESGITAESVTHGKKYSRTEVHLKGLTAVRIVERSGATGSFWKEDLKAEHMEARSVEVLPKGDRAEKAANFAGKHEKEEQQHQLHGHVMSTVGFHVGGIVEAKDVLAMREREAPAEDNRTVASLRLESRLRVAETHTGPTGNPRELLTSDIHNRLKSFRGQFSMIAELFPAQLLGKHGMIDTATALESKKYVMIYFSAHWCPKCRVFTPKLADMYKKAALEKQIEVIFAAVYEDEAGFKDYYKEMPWMAVPFSDRGKTEELQERYDVRKIPTLIVLNSNGDLETAEGDAECSKYFGGGDTNIQSVEVRVVVEPSHDRKS